MAIEQLIREAASILEGQSLDPEGKEVRVTVLSGGKSVNGYSYDVNALNSIAKMIEGAKAYADHARTDADQTTRSVRDIVGFYHDAAYVPGPGIPRVDATLHIMEAAPWLRSLIKEACTLGRPDLVGLSIDIYGTWQLNESTKAKDVTKVLSLNSCDIVTKPSAGGAFQRILQSEQQGEPPHMDPITPPNVQDPPGTPPPTNPPATPPAPVPVPAPVIPPAPTTPSHILEAQTLLDQQRKDIDALMAQARLDRSQLVLERRLMESILPDAVKAQVKARFVNRIFEETELDTEMTTALTMLAQLTRDGMIKGNGYDKAELQGSQITEAEKVQAAFDLIFEQHGDMADVRTKFPGVRAFTSIREAYARVTGDSALYGGISGRSELGQIRIGESAPVDRITEADTTTASFSFLLGTSMNKRLLKDYQAWPAEWAKFCTIVPIKDFKQQTRVRLGAFGSLPIVAEDTTYTSVTLQDSAATYVPQKRGNLVTVSRETIINDDLFAIKQIPTKLAVAAAYTLAEFVYAFLSANPNIYDGNALFTSGGAHSNLGAAALSSAAMQTGVTAMREQTNFAGKRLGLRPKFLIVPPELEFVAMVVTKSAGVPGSTNNDINPMLGYVVPIVSPQLTNTTQWFFSADPMVIDTIEVGFVGGQVNPALFIQDQPLFGLNFTQDIISYKIRHEYGGAVVDYRGLYRGI